jgi:hypothetical protein
MSDTRDSGTPDQPPTPRGDVRGPATQPDAIELLLTAEARALNVWIIQVVSRGLIDTTAGRRQADLYVDNSAGDSPGHYELTLGADALAPLDGHRFEWWGLRADPTGPYDPLLCCHFDLSPTFRIFVRFLRQRIWHGQSPIYGELLTIPGAPEEQRVGGLERPHRAPERTAAWAALRKLREYNALRGGPAGPRKYPTATSFHRAIRDKIYARCYRNNWSLADYPQTKYAAWLGCAYDTYKAARDAYGLSADGIRAGYARYQVRQRKASTN